MGKSEIAWCSHTENYLAGCTKVTAACANCYAETMSVRLATMPNSPARYHDDVTRGKRWTGRVVFDPDALGRIFMGLRNAKKPRRVFINSMSDSFHDAAEPSWVPLAEAIRATDEAAQRAGHVIMLLTKRPQNLLRWQREHFPDGLPPWVWVGCTVELQATADERVPLLVQVQARIRFLSMEPLLGPVDLLFAAFAGGSFSAMEGIGWVIAGCESEGQRVGPRHTDDAWLREIARDCATARVPFFLKQRGKVGEPIDHSGTLFPVGAGTPCRGVPS